MENSCENCGADHAFPGKLIRATEGLENCAVCGKLINMPALYEATGIDTTKWDTYFHTLCKAVSTKSPCLSRQIGAILVRDHSIVSIGFNGPPRGIPHCGHDRLMKDEMISKALDSFRLKNAKDISPSYIADTCPRKILGYESGTHMELCPAQHAERNAFFNAARLGVSVLDTTLYMNSIIPCQQCFGALINAGVAGVVIEDAKVYDEHTQFLLNNSEIKIREFKL